MQQNSGIAEQDLVRRHYAADGLVDRLKSALMVFGPEQQQLTYDKLSALDQFHTRGLEATKELAELAGLTEDMMVLDVGCGLGGPARFIAQDIGCFVTGVDSSESFVDAARYLTERCGLGAKSTFITSDALNIPFDDETFDAVLLQHVAMNIEDRVGLYREMRRVLKGGARFAIFDVVSKLGQPFYPLPWSRTPRGSFLMTADQTREAVELGGFRTILFRDDSEISKAWFARLREAGPPPSPNLGLVMGPDIVDLAGNLGRGLMEGQLGILTAVFEAQ